MENPFSLEGKTILITGASSGLGRSTAIQCSKMGAKVVLVARNEERLKETMSNLVGDGHMYYCVNLINKEAYSEFVDSIPVLNGIVYCAGITRTKPVKYIKEEDINDVFQTNIISSMQITQLVLKKKKIAKRGSIVFISSIDTFNVNKGNSIYSASKGAVNSFAKVLALELSSQNITVNCIQPGFIPSGFLSAGAITPEQLEEEQKRYPLGFGEPEDIANGAVYLLSDAAKWITGSIITIDGGVTLK